jgi:hypothetical protein
MNRDWHEAHVMPKNATIAQRIAWHVEHARVCACRPIPAKVAEAMAAGKKSKPARKPAARSSGSRRAARP